jgi:site-specific recombinase XerD
VLKTHKASQAKDRLGADELWRDTGLVFCTAIGTALDAANVRRGFRVVAKKAKLTGSWTSRELRRSFVSLLSANGVPIESIAQLVGHADTAVTEAVYHKEFARCSPTRADVIGAIFTRTGSGRGS